MGNSTAISLRNVSKCFKTYEKPSDRLLELLLPSKCRAKEFWALKDINLDIPKGTTVGLIGRNGSGKSTLLQLVTGTLTPTTGEIHVKGRISALLELGSGFNPEFTGRQNVFFNGRLLGLSQSEIEKRIDEILAFADIGDFIDKPTKTYSSGMFVRLAFAVAVNVDPEILIVDEALAVGDVIFQHRCMRKMRSLMDSGVTTLFVSHDLGSIKTLCNSAIVMHNGRFHMQGLPNATIIEYLKLVTHLELEDSSMTQNPTDTNEEYSEYSFSIPALTRSEGSTNQAKNLGHLYENATHRRGSGKGRISSISILNEQGEILSEPCTIGFNNIISLVLSVEIFGSMPHGCMIGFYFCDKRGNELIGSNTTEEGVSISTPLDVGDQLEISFKFSVPLRPDSYSITVAGSEKYEAVTFDWIDNALVLQVLPPETGKVIHAMVAQPMDVRVHHTAFQSP